MFNEWLMGLGQGYSPSIEISVNTYRAAFGLWQCLHKFLNFIF
ncbi:hypothetical protein AM1_D0249 (plasmid) [Acaryochloris marina MBIC11017]|uniref:Uncharacterized protein n=1 Tax=Acaryochloris marina (strain MBIC 11017) TaxID=329726 RepID=A8ZP04_ACAM1|nr:hypothetical protein AM1_D0249 [Acaryochloris marina MBIC11017]